jgi:hypothetical protein
MTFKNNQGGVPGYVIGLILAIALLVVSFFVFPLIKDAMAASTKPVTNACEIAKGTCEVGDSCTAGEKLGFIACPKSGTGAEAKDQICCKA